MRSRPLFTAAAIFASATALFAASAALTRAAALYRAGIATDPSLFGRAALTLFLGGGFAALLSLLARACALTAYAGVDRPIRAGFQRMPYLVTVAAVELTVQGMLLFGALMVSGRVIDEKNAPVKKFASSQATFGTTSICKRRMTVRR